MVANSGAMLVRFTSNNRGNRTGFSGSWSTTGGGCPAKTVADNFNSVSFSQNNGTQNWATDWLEIGESDGPSSGIARVNSSNCTSGNCLRISEPSSSRTWSNRGAQREANLSSATSATLSFNCYTGYAGGTQSVTLEVPSNGGGSWTTLQTYNITGTSFSATAQSFDIGAYKSANTRIRFLSSGNSARAGLYVDDLNITYFESCPLSASNSANIGRFYPDHFNITPGSITEACVSGSFTYLGQDFVNGYTLTAKNTANATTLNYKDSFARLSNTLGTFTFAGIDNSVSGSPLPLSSRLSNSTNSVSWLDGVGSASSTLKLSRLGTSILTTTDGATVLTSAFNLDTDNNSSNDHIQTNSVSGVQRYGRLVIDNAFAPEVLDLAMLVRSEYWTGSTFTTNTSDLCSANNFTASNFMISDPYTSDSLTVGLTSKTYPLTGSYTRDLILSAPNKAGPLDVSLDVPGWLELNFNAGLSDDEPTGRALFGQYRGNDRIIFWLEQFE